jgi:hypothetical protein
VSRLEIPAFARKYRTTCSTCHTAAPKLNVLGEAFRLNGYRFPENDQLLRKDDPVPLGAEPWEELWPRAIWPGELPGAIPLALRIKSDLLYTADPDSAASWNFLFPSEVYLLAGATLGDDIGVFLSMEWTREEGVEVNQAKVEFQDPVPGLPDRSHNLWLGRQNLYLTTLADRQIDRAAILDFKWQTYRVSDLVVANSETGEVLQSENRFQLRQTQPAIELNGLPIGRLYYGIGLSQGAGSLTSDNNARKDFYYKFRYKLGGLGLDGSYADKDGPVLSGMGQLMDRAIILEHFGYFGAEPVRGGADDRHRSFGVAARGLYERADVGLGFVWGRNENPWGSEAPGAVSNSSFFAKAEYLLFPWLIGSLKFDTFDVELSEEVRSAGYVGTHDQTRWMPGIVALIRHNVKLVAEAELFTRHVASDASGERDSQGLWLRLDVAF